MSDFLKEVSWTKALFWIVVVITLGAVHLSTEGTDTFSEMTIPLYIYLFGFLGAMVYVFTALAHNFGDEAYVYKLLSRAVAALLLAAGVYLLAFAFPVASGEMTTQVPTYDRVVAGLAFVAGLYVSMTLKALGSIAERLLGVEKQGRQE